MDSWDNHDGDSFRPRGWMSALVLLVTFLLLPEKMLCFSEEIWKLQRSFRREVLQVFRSVSESPAGRQLVSATLWIFRKVSGGRWASPCLPPHSLRARAGGHGEVLILWSGHYQVNPFHEESYIYAWKMVREEVSDATWKEESVVVNLCKELGAAPGRWGTILDLPDQAVTRIRVCATNRLGRSEWSREEVEVTTRTAKQPDMKIRVTSAEGIQSCAQCDRALPKKPGALYARLVSRSVFSPGCQHGPFCGRCQQRLARKVLPCCVCRGLIESWNETE
ncbi:unnamed protein product [Effrenium voratum]|uniref:Fibronectin type-III domain-containing protein n=1 Tax=Effrenium voratum TaxID=2562239 RepID=A0AA36HJI3_9DINO|nr:unnamed protein product [Effrenium voratum]CAJ1456065.1 unnamed protein product [Effrenium voratum]